MGGAWRSRRIRFEPTPGLRPTPDRVRETLFNWLQGVVAGSRCLDLFAGSGALGLEALSRGAAEVEFVEREPRAAAALERALGELGARGARVVRGDAFGHLRGPAARPFDVVFLDPPFGEGRLGELCTLLEDGHWLAPHAWIYLEYAAREGSPALPPGWRPWRETRAGEVRGFLARRAAAAATDAGGAPAPASDA